MTATLTFGANAELKGRRQSRRVAIDLPATAELLTGHARVQLVSLSSRGAGVVFSDEPPRIGAELVLSFERFECFGKVVWSRGDRAGIAFYDPLTEDDVVEARHASDTRNEREARRLQSIARAWVEGRAGGAGGQPGRP
jgi:hypothetical protein